VPNHSNGEDSPESQSSRAVNTFENLESKYKGAEGRNLRTALEYEMPERQQPEKHDAEIVLN
jgi:hypothetical protein